MAGLTCAFLLNKEGKPVVVLEVEGVCSGDRNSLLEARLDFLTKLNFLKIILSLVSSHSSHNLVSAKLQSHVE